jgi:hypothetical protein
MYKPEERNYESGILALEALCRVVEPLFSS